MHHNVNDKFMISYVVYSWDGCFPAKNCNLVMTYQKSGEFCHRWRVETLPILRVWSICYYHFVINARWENLQKGQGICLWQRVETPPRLTVSSICYHHYKTWCQRTSLMETLLQTIKNTRIEKKTCKDLLAYNKHRPTHSAFLQTLPHG